MKITNVKKLESRLDSKFSKKSIKESLIESEIEDWKIYIYSQSKKFRDELYKTSSYKLRDIYKLLVYRQTVYLEVEIASNWKLDWNFEFDSDLEGKVSRFLNRIELVKVGGKDYQFYFVPIAIIRDTVKVKELTVSDIESFRPGLLEPVAKGYFARKAKLLGINHKLSETDLVKIIKMYAVPMRAYKKTQLKSYYKPVEQIEAEVKKPKKKRIGTGRIIRYVR